MVARRQLRSPLFVLVIGLLASAVAAVLVARIEDDRRTVRFEALADAVVNTIETRLDEQRLLLRGAAALFQASREVSRAEFDAYVERLKLPTSHPGVLGVGYAMRVSSPAQLAPVLARARASGADITPWPPSGTGPSSIITYLNPDSPVNRRALGFDMMSEPVRAAAMRRAMQTGEAMLSGKVTLVQDRGGRPGFLLYVPIGGVTGAPAGSAAVAGEGWTYSPLRAHELFTAALSRPNLSGAQVAVFDGSPAPENLLFQSASFAHAPELSAQRRLRFAGRTWTILVAASPAFFASSPVTSVWIILAGGLLATGLMAALAMQQARSVARTEAAIARATHELRTANDALVTAAQAREAAEAQIRQMQKIEAIGQLTGGIAHDFNNMLAVVLGNLDMAERRMNEPHRLARAIDAAKDGARRAAELTRRLLAFGRQQPLAPQVLDPNRLVSGMSELLRRTLGEQVELETVLAGGLWRVEADAGQLENAVLNLAINGRDAMRDGGRLTIETHNCHLDANYAASHDGLLPGQYVLIAVTDSGTGMAPDVVQRAFDPFFTTKEVGKGTGLGLSQVFGFVKQSGGHVRIYSEVGQGTTVKIYLPRVDGVPVEHEAGSPDVALPRGRAAELILVVEDEDGVRRVSVEALRELGYTVIHAASGAQALDLLEQHGGVSLLFTDVVMAGMNGRVLAERARARFPALKVLFTTGYTPNAIVHDGRLDPNVALLTKPFTLPQLAAKVREALDRAATG